MAHGNVDELLNTLGERQAFLCLARVINDGLYKKVLKILISAHQAPHKQNKRCITVWVDIHTRQANKLKP